MESDTLEAYPTPEAFLPSASLDPPVTIASLSELDWVRIINDVKLRHELNFGPDILYVCRRRSDQKSNAEAYWEALTLELTPYMQSYRKERGSIPDGSRQSDSQSLLDPPLMQQPLLRLRRMFITIRDILKSLIPESQCDSVDQRLDVDLLMQEFEHGVCDVKDLSSWLGTVLRGSCTPLLDYDVDYMVGIVHQGVDAEDARRLVRGLRVLFDILEMMKLVGIKTIFETRSET